MCLFFAELSSSLPTFMDAATTTYSTTSDDSMVTSSMEILVPEQIDPTNATIEEIGAHQACSGTQAYYPLTQKTPKMDPPLISTI